MFVRKGKFKKEGVDIPGDIQLLPTELKVKKTKWLLFPVCRPSCHNDMYYVSEPERIVDFYNKNIENIIY